MQETNERTSILGFDLGHGESSVAFLHDAARQGFQPECLFTPKSQPTILATLRDGRGIIWGQSAWKNPRVRDEDVREFSLGFKAKPGNQDTDTAIRTFANCVYGDAVAELHGRLGARTEWFVGCPSAWDEAVQNAYRELFLQAG